ncbi:MAG: DUF481 domain-containing protein [Novosphingobium sp.]|nr:DUF481 domain-containing protein [Novosphingobium sp.]MCP5404361.1 DUF481 domain-containing protein [Novosphingobium sp.]
MIDAAIATGDPATVKTVADLAIQTNPGDAAEIEAMRAQFLAGQERLAEAKAARKEQQLRSAGLFDNWSGKGEIGASRSTGNSSETGLTLGLTLERKGIDWRHKLTAAADYHRTDGKTTKEQFLFAYEPNYRLGDGAFTFGLAQYERDRFQGFSSRISLSGGLGYRFVDRDDMQLSVKAGPAWRRTSLIPSGHRSHLAGLAALDFDWQFAKNMKLTQTASAYVQSDNSTLASVTGLQARLNGKLSARVSYTVEHETDPPDGAVRTDTLSRFTLIYDF